MALLWPRDPLAVEVTAAIQDVDTGALRTLLAGHPQLATARIGDLGGNHTLLHVATDWPGHFPHVADTIAALSGHFARPGCSARGRPTR